MNLDVFFYEVFDEERDALQQFIPARWQCGFTHLAVQETDHPVPPARVISTRTQSRIPPAWARHLSGILSRSAGFDHLQQFVASAPCPVATGHLFAYSGRAVAEHAALLWLALLRRLPRQQRAIAHFQRDHLTGGECLGRTLAVFGVGDIGGHVAAVGHGLGMNILGVDLVQRHPGIPLVDKRHALQAADVVVASMNLNETNDRYFGPEELSLMKPGALFVNVARGEFSRCSDLLPALASGRLGGVGLDVYAEESLISPALRAGRRLDHPEFIAFEKLRMRDDVIMTPHNAFNTREALVRKSRQSIRQLDYFFNHGMFSPTPPEDQPT